MSACSLKYSRRGSAVLAYRPSSGDSAVSGADLPPRPECAPAWQPRFRAALPGLRLTLLVGRYAQAYYLGKRRRQSLAETVRAYRDYLPEFFPLPHPSWRNKLWLKANPWFELRVIPALRESVAACIRQV